MNLKKTWGRSKYGIGILVAVLIVVAFCALVQGKEKLVVTYNPMPLNVPSIVMKQQGFLEEAVADLGLEVEYTAFLAGYLMTEAMAAGKLDIAAVMGGTSTITSYVGGRQLEVFAAYSQAPGGFALVVKADSPIQRPEELKGLTVGLPVGTETHLLLGKVLPDVGLALDDVKVVNMLVPDAVTALMAGQIDAACVVEPVLSRLAAQGKIRVLRDGTGLMPGLTVATVRKNLPRKTAILTAYLNAFARSLEYMENQPQETLAMVAEATDLPPELVQSIMAKYSFSSEISPDVLDSLEDTAVFLREIGIVEEAVDLQGLINTSVIDGLAP